MSRFLVGLTLRKLSDDVLVATVQQWQGEPDGLYCRRSSTNLVRCVSKFHLKITLNTNILCDETRNLCLVLPAMY